MKQTIVTLFLLFFLLFITIDAKEQPGSKQNSFRKATGTPSATLLNINRISAWYESNGEMERNPFDGNSGLTYPRGTAAAIYVSGLVWGGKVNDGKTPVIRVGGSDYNRGVQPGAILGKQTGLFEDPNNANVRIWRIRKDYATADLRQDAGEFFMKGIASVTDADVATIRAQYKKDWQEWPASKGAPFYDSNNDGVYTPQFDLNGNPKLYPAADEPGLANADQVIWFVCHDLTGPSQWASPPIGLEQQTTLWGYNRANEFGDILFKKFKLIYKGTATTPSNATITDMYLCHWSDPDLGDAGDDYVGCDTVLSLGYVYNSKNIDRSYLYFGITPPAMGYDFLQGPIVPSANDTAVFDLKYRAGFKNLPMTSFIYFAAGGRYGDPGHVASGAIQWYQMLRGLPPMPQGPPDPPMEIDPITKKPTTFWLPGDPVTGTGWIDGVWDTPGDRRMLQNSGPFTMALGDTQEVVVGVVGGIGNNYLFSILETKKNDRYVQFAYDKLFQFVPPAVTASLSFTGNTQVKIILKATQVPANTTASISLKQPDGTSLATLQLFDDGAHDDGAANDGVFGASTTIATQLDPLYLSASFSQSGKLYLFDKMIDKINVVGPIDIVSGTVFYDNINDDKIVNNGEFIRYGITLKNNSLFTVKKLTLQPATDLDFGKLVAIGQLAPGQQFIQSYNPNDPTTYFSFRLPINYSDSTYKANFFVTDSLGNLWKTQVVFPVVKKSFIADTLRNKAVNIVGENDATVDFVLFDPIKVGNQYDIWFGGKGVERNWTVVKPITGNDYATVSATLLPKNQVPAINTLPYAKGSGTFTINDAKTQIAYSVSYDSLSGNTTGAHIHFGTAGIVGPAVKTLTLSGKTATGVWSKSDGSEPLVDSLITAFTSGNLYVNFHTAANAGGEIRGQIADGLLPRQVLPNPLTTITPITSLQENKLIGFSLYVNNAIVGIKSVNQVAPTTGNVFGILNPEGTYRIGIDNSFTLAGGTLTQSAVEIRFNNEINWALMIPPIQNPTPVNVFFVKVPFAIYKDTTRVWPVIQNSQKLDSTWNIDSLKLINGKKVFESIAIVADRDGSNNDISYYSPSFPSFPPTSNLWKGRIMSGVNWIVKNIYFVNEKNNGIPPASGTNVRFTQYKSINLGDIKSITLAINSVKQLSATNIPQDFELSQNYPNPFNPTTKIEFALPKQTRITLKVFDILGREVATLVDGSFGTGRFVYEWNGKNSQNISVASGVYFYQLRAGNFVQSKKMLLLK